MPTLTVLILLPYLHIRLVATVSATQIVAVALPTAEGKTARMNIILNMNKRCQLTDRVRVECGVGILGY